MLKVLKWAARAPGLMSAEDWLAWAKAPQLPASDEPLKRQHIPAVIGRRASRVSQYALEAALEVVVGENPGYGVFASRHGEIGHTVELLQSIANHEPLSPIAFSQSVHNTAAGLFTIIKKSHLRTTSICAGTFTFDMALLEAATYLETSPNENVLLVCFDQSLPEYYQKELTEHSLDYSVALLLSKAAAAANLTVRKNDSRLEDVPRAIAFLQTFLTSQSDQIIYSRPDNRWDICEK